MLIYLLEIQLYLSIFPSFNYIYYFKICGLMNIQKLYNPIQEFI
jgi:hypothetical protein